MIKFCPECGTRLLHKGSFCQECGCKLPNTGTEGTDAKVAKPEDPHINTVDGFGTVDHIIRTEADIVSPDLKFISKSFGPCNFDIEDFDVIFCGFEEMESFLSEMRKRYGNELYDGLLKELRHHTYNYVDYAAPIIEQGNYPSSFTPFLTNVRKFFERTVNGLKKRGEVDYIANIRQFSLLIRIIDIINGGNYNKEFLYESLPANNPSPNLQRDKNQTNVRNADIRDKRPSLPVRGEDAPDFKDQIESLEKDLASHKPALKINDYDPSIDYVEELDKLIGLQGLKMQLIMFMDNFRLQLLRQKEHPELKTSASFNCVFKGKPGTGKTTVARLVAGLLRQNGIISGGRCVEVDASSLVSGWIGFSAKVTTLAAYKAMDGVLFIDEAYALMNNFENSSGSGPGKDVIDALTPIMENHRDRLLVIIAGYDKEMDEFLKASNTGFPSRFKSVMQFEDYNANEMTEIFCQMAKAEFYVVGKEEQKRIRFLFDYIYRSIPFLPAFANARTVRNVFDQVKQRASQRMLKDPDCDHDLITMDDVTLNEEEIRTALGHF